MRKLRASRSQKIVTESKEGGTTAPDQVNWKFAGAAFSSDIALLQRMQVLRLETRVQGIHREMDAQAFTVYYF